MYLLKVIQHTSRLIQWLTAVDCLRATPVSVDNTPFNKTLYDNLGITLFDLHVMP